MHNLLIPEILLLLRQQSLGLSEYEIMQYFAEHEIFQDLSEETQLVLFQKHFIIMNALYELQYQLWQDEQVYLDVSPLNIQMVFVENNEAGNALAISESKKLSEYYRDWKNFKNTNEADVNKLLSNFWQHFVSTDERNAAYDMLEISPDAAKEQIIESYRRLAATHHPDKGGDKEMFIRIRQAYEILKINP